MSEQIIQPPNASPINTTVNLVGRPVKVIYEGVEALMIERGTYVGATPVFLLLSNGMDNITMIALEYVRVIKQIPVQENVEEIKSAENVKALVVDEVATPVDKEPDGDDVA